MRYAAVRKASSQYENVTEEKARRVDQFRHCVGVSFQQSHFVEECEDMKGDEKYPEK